MTKLYTSVLKGIFVISNIVNAIKIENLVMPELVQMGNGTEIILDCQFSKVKGDGLIVRWYFNGNEEPVYQWRPNTTPIVNGILRGRLALPFNISSSYRDEGRAIRIVRLDPELSGVYSCSVEFNGTNVRQTKSMLVFSPEQELDLKLKETKKLSKKTYEVKCTARGLFPLPDLILEFNNKLIPNQWQRTWRSGGDGPLYDVESTALSVLERRGTVTCRLLLPEAGYTAIKEKVICTLDQCRNMASTLDVSVVYIFVEVILTIILINSSLFSVGVGRH